MGPLSSMHKKHKGTEKVGMRLRRKACMGGMETLGQKDGDGNLRWWLGTGRERAEAWQVKAF